ncbi:MAG TPA: hypothetical protein V6D29_03965 [Leptolyngbyaceae cyanobacterium]
MLDLVKEMESSLEISLSYQDGQLKISALQFNLEITSENLRKGLDELHEELANCAWEKLKSGELKASDPFLITLFGEDGDLELWICDREYRDRCRMVVELTREHFPQVIALAKKKSSWADEDHAIVMFMPMNNRDTGFDDTIPEELEMTHASNLWKKRELEAYKTLEEEGPNSPRWISFCLGVGWDDQVEQWQRCGVIPPNYEQILQGASNDPSSDSE